MRFNGKSIYDVHSSISIAKEIPPGMPERDIHTVSGWNGETVAGTSYKRGVYIARVNIAGRIFDSADDASSVFLMHRRNRKPWLVVMKLKDFLALLK